MLNYIKELSPSHINSEKDSSNVYYSPRKINKLYDNCSFIQTNFYEYNGYAICGGRGWICPNEAAASTILANFL